MPRRTAVFFTAVTALVLSVISVVLVYSASRRNYGAALAIRQSIYFLIGLISAFALARLSPRQIFRNHWFLYGIGIFLLVLTLFLGTSVRGDRSWIDLGLFHVQTSELMKPLLIISLAVVSEQISSGYRSLSVGLLELTLLTFTPMALVLLQPDYGTAMVYLSLFVFWLALMGLWREPMTLIVAGLAAASGMIMTVTNFSLGNLIWSGFSQSWFLVDSSMGWFVIGAMILVPAVLPYLLQSRVTVSGAFLITVGAFLAGTKTVPLLAGYQQERLRVFLDPYKAPLRSGYNVIQSQIALGSGGLFGQGYLQGTQSQLGFIPELWTDFIFSVAIEELGLLFGLLFLGLLILLVYSVFSAAALMEDWKDYYLCAGIGCVWMIHSLINLGVCVGLLPVVGLPLPFTSYGGSFLVTNWFMVGLLICVNSGFRKSSAFR
ncbi:MAG: FtsW/RodA/SpoVE family cell cycle protein [bacterium]